MNSESSLGGMGGVDGKNWMATAIASSRAKAKKKYEGSNLSGSFLEEIEAARGFSSAFKEEGKKKVIGWIASLFKGGGG